MDATTPPSSVDKLANTQLRKKQYNFSKKGKKNKKKSLSYNRGGKKQKNSQTWDRHNASLQNANNTTENTNNYAEGGGVDDVGFAVEMMEESLPVASMAKKAHAVDNWKESRAITSLTNKVVNEESKRMAAEAKAMAIQSQFREKRKVIAARLEEEIGKRKEESLKRAAAEQKSKISGQQLKCAQQKIQREKKVSRQMNDKAKEEAVDMMEEARAMMHEATAEKAAALEAELKIENSCNERLRKERHIHAASLKQAQNQCQAKLNLESGGHDAIMKHLNEKHEKEGLSWSKEIADMHTELLQKTTVHKGELDNANAKILAEKKKRRLANEQATAAKGLMAADITYLCTWLDEMNDELSEAKFATK